MPDLRLLDNDGAVCADERGVEVEDYVDEEDDVDDGVDDEDGDVLVGEALAHRQVVRHHDHREEGQCQDHPVPRHLQKKTATMLSVAAAILSP